MEIKTTKSAKFFDGYRTAKRLAEACASDGAHIHHDEATGAYDLIVPATGEKLSLIGLCNISTMRDYGDCKTAMSTPWANEHRNGSRYVAWDAVSRDTDDHDEYCTWSVLRDIRATSNIARCTDAFIRERLRLCCLAYADFCKKDEEKTVAVAEVAG